MKRLHWFILSILWAALTWQLTMTPQPVVLEVFWLNSLMMMSAHFIFFGIQAVLLFLSSLHTPYCILTTSIYGLLIELVQSTVPGRSADPVDWILDTLGAIVFLGILNKYFKKFVN